MDIISATGLTKRYEDLTAVDGVSFTVREGECFGFLGPNGAGKTTTMRMIQCVSPVTSGVLTVAGLSVTDDDRAIKSMLGVAPQETNLDEDLTIRENLIVYSSYFNIPKEEAEKRTDDLLAFFQLEGKKDTDIDKLSGGMKRRLLLARALINRPKILILDEPTVGLDPQARHMIWDQLTRLKSQGSTIILTTHYMEEAERICDRLVIMDSGKILAEGAPADLVKKYVGENVVEARNDPAVQACLRGSSGVKEFEVIGENVFISTTDPQEVIDKLLRSCNVSSASVRKATLEDVFLKLTGRSLRE